MCLPLATTWLCDGFVMAMACWWFAKGELAFWLFLHDVQGFELAKA